MLECPVCCPLASLSLHCFQCSRVSSALQRGKQRHTSSTAVSDTAAHCTTISHAVRHASAPPQHPHCIHLHTARRTDMSDTTAPPSAAMQLHNGNSSERHSDSSSSAAHAAALAHRNFYDRYSESTAPQQSEQSAEPHTLSPQPSISDAQVSVSTPSRTATAAAAALLLLALLLLRSRLLRSCYFCTLRMCALLCVLLLE